MRAILIPVKSFSQVKQRLAPQLALPERVSLVQAMRTDVFSSVAAVRGVDRVFVVTSELQVIEEAELRGWYTIRETLQRSESDSVDFASKWCAKRGITALLRLPTDIPLLTSPDIESLFDAAPFDAPSFRTIDPAPATVLVPSRDGTGTNALLRWPPALFPSRFGPGSFALHLAEAARAGATVKIVRNPRIEFDVDDPQDLADLRKLGSTRQAAIGPATSQWLGNRGT